METVRWLNRQWWYCYMNKKDEALWEIERLATAAEAVEDPLHRAFGTDPYLCL